MNSYRIVLITIAVVLTVWVVKVYAGTMTMTTYYPAPTGSYDSLKVKKGLIIPCYNNANPAPGTMPNNSIWIDRGASSC